MKCEDCLTLLEEYFDGELSHKPAARVRAHLSSCTACLEAYESLQYEQEIYARCAQDLEPEPPLWETVRARIERERGEASAAASTGGRRQWSALFGALFSRPAPVAFAAVALLLVLLGVGFRLFVSPTAQVETATGKVRAVDAAQAAPEAKDAGQIARAVQASHEERDATPAREQVAPRASSRSGVTTSLKALPSAPSSRASAREASLPDSIERIEEAVEADELASADEAQSDGQSNDSAHHFERAQLLLRSLKNMRQAGEQRSLDISYEKQQSKRLLYRNTVLKQRAESSGNLPVKEALSDLEPLLLEIANLPDRPTPDAMRAIRERVQNGEVVGRLQIYARGAER